MNFDQLKEIKKPDSLIVPLRDIQLIHFQPRRNPDQDAIERLALSLSTTGQMQPVGVRRHGNGWRLIFGYLRFYAARQLGWKTIQAREYPETENRELVDLALWASENLHHSVPALDEMAVVVSRLAEAGMAVAAIAAALSKSVVWVDGMLNIARDPVARRMIEKRRLDDPEAWAVFTRLAQNAQKTLLDSMDPITLWRCEQMTQKNASVPEQKTRKISQEAIKQNLWTQDLWSELPDVGTKPMYGKHSDERLDIGAKG